MNSLIKINKRKGHEALNWLLYIKPIINQLFSDADAHNTKTHVVPLCQPILKVTLMACTKI